MVLWSSSRLALLYYSTLLVSYYCVKPARKNLPAAVADVTWLHNQGLDAFFVGSRQKRDTNIFILSCSAARHYNDFQTFNCINVIKFIFITVSNKLIMIMINVNDHRGTVSNKQSWAGNGNATTRHTV